MHSSFVDSTITSNRTIPSSFFPSLDNYPHYPQYSSRFFSQFDSSSSLFRGRGIEGLVGNNISVGRFVPSLLLPLLSSSSMAILLLLLLSLFYSLPFIQMTMNTVFPSWITHFLVLTWVHSSLFFIFRLPKGHRWLPTKFGRMQLVLLVSVRPRKPEFPSNCLLLETYN